MKLSKIIIIGLILLTVACTEEKSNQTQKNSLKTAQEAQNEKPTKIPILNFGTFHMGSTTDAHTTEFDQYEKENQLKLHDIVKKLALFKPTVLAPY